MPLCGLQRPLQHPFPGAVSRKRHLKGFHESGARPGRKRHAGSKKGDQAMGGGEGSTTWLLG